MSAGEFMRVRVCLSVYVRERETVRERESLCVHVCGQPEDNT